MQNDHVEHLKPPFFKTYTLQILPQRKHDRQHDSGNIRCIFISRSSSASKAKQSLHIIAICHRKTSKKQNIWLPDRKHSFPVVVANDTIFTENDGWMEQLLMSVFITVLLRVAASPASTVLYGVSLYSHCFFTYCCMNTDPFLPPLSLFLVLILLL